MYLQKIFLITFIIIVVMLGIIGYFEPKTALNSFLFSIPIFILLFVVAIRASKYGKKLTLKYEEGMKATLSSLELEYLYVRKLLYAVGKFDGYQLCFKYGMITPNDWTPIPGIFSKVAVLCRYKIPGSENTTLQCSIFPSNRSPELRSLLGWQNPEPGFFVAKSKSQGEQESLQQFQMLREETKEALRAVTSVFGGSCGIAPDWETIMVGKDEALRLAGNDPSVLAQLDFQVKIPFETSPDDVHRFLTTASRAVALLNRDLSKTKPSSSV